jgi:hypothetical protein
LILEQLKDGKSSKLAVYRVDDVPDVELPLPYVPLPPELPLEVPPEVPLLSLEVPPDMPLLPPAVPPDKPLLPLEVPPEVPLLSLEVPPDMPLLPVDPVAPGWSEAERRSQPASAMLIRPAARRIFEVLDMEFMVVPFTMVSN